MPTSRPSCSSSDAPASPGQLSDWYSACVLCALSLDSEASVEDAQAAACALELCAQLGLERNLESNNLQDGRVSVEDDACPDGAPGWVGGREVVVRGGQRGERPARNEASTLPTTLLKQAETAAPRSSPNHHPPPTAFFVAFDSLIRIIDRFSPALQLVQTLSRQTGSSLVS